MQQLLEHILSLKGALAGVGALSTIFALVLGTGLVRRRRVALAIYHAFNIVEDVSAELRAEGKDSHTLDKTTRALACADEWMRVNGWRKLKPGEEALARLTWRSMHGEQKAAQSDHPLTVNVTDRLS